MTTEPIRRRDARGLVLLKADYEDGEQYLSDQDCEGARKFVCLGEYDGLLAFPLHINENTHDASLLNNQPLLRMVNRKNKELREKIRHAQHFSALYLVRDWEGSQAQADEEAEKVNRFWAEENAGAFFCVTSFYSDQENHPTKKELAAALENIRKGGAGFDCLVYASLQLAEQVVVWKADRLYDILHAMELLYRELPSYGYARTICAVPYARLKEKSLWPAETAHDEANRRMLTIQVAAKSFEHFKWLVFSRESPFHILWAQRDTVHGERIDQFFTHGNEDYVGTALNVSERLFYELLDLLLQNFDDDMFRQAVLHFETQFGIELKKNGGPKSKQELYPISQDNKGNPLQTIVRRIARHIETLSMQDWIKGQVWYMEFASQARMLRQMAGSCVMDAVCYLLIEGVSYFCDWLDHVLYVDGDMQKKVLRSAAEIAYELNCADNIAAILGFLKGCSRLSTHMTRSDAIIQIHPTMPPPPDNFCTAIMEYSFAFLFKATSFLRDLEFSGRVDKPPFTHALVPSLERWINTEEQLLNRREKLKGKSSNALLYLEVPYENMAEPYYMIASLVHESGHYFGDRCRHKRMYTMLFCLTIHLMNLLQLSDDAYDYIYNTLYGRMRLEYDNMDEMLYFSVLKAQIEEAVAYLLSTEENKSLLEAFFVGEDKALLWENVEKILCSNGVRITGESTLHKMINVYGYLFKECYADMVMAKTLELSFSQYLRMFAFAFAPMAFIETEDNDAEQLRLLLFQRIFLVAKTLEKNESAGWANLEDQLDQFLSDQADGRKYKSKLECSLDDVWTAPFPDFFRTAACRLREEPAGFAYASPSPDENEAYLLMPELYALIIYLDECCKGYDTALQDSLRDAQMELQQLFLRDVIGDRILENGFLDVIQKSREHTLEKLK